MCNCVSTGEKEAFCVLCFSFQKIREQLDNLGRSSILDKPLSQMQVGN